MIAIWKTPDDSYVVQPMLKGASLPGSKKTWEDLPIGLRNAIAVLVQVDVGCRLPQYGVQAQVNYFEIEDSALGL
jgi:hypothetical protein